MPIFQGPEIDRPHVGLLLTPLGSTKIIIPKSPSGFSAEEISEIIGGGRITLVPLGDEKPHRKGRIMCINAEGKDLNLEFNDKAYSIFDISCWGSALIINTKDFTGT